MRSIPIDQARAGAFQLVAVLPKPGEVPGVQALTKDGIPKWIVQCLHTPLAEGDFASKAALEEIVVTAHQMPAIQPLMVLQFQDLIARHWSMSGRSGVSFSATAVRAVQKRNDA